MSDSDSDSDCSYRSEDWDYESDDSFNDSDEDADHVEIIKTLFSRLSTTQLSVHISDAKKIDCHDKTCVCNISSYEDYLYYNIPDGFLYSRYIIRWYNKFAYTPMLDVLGKVAEVTRPELEIHNSSGSEMLRGLKYNPYFEDIIKGAYVMENVDINATKPVVNESTAKGMDKIEKFEKDRERVFKRFISIFHMINIQRACDRYNRSSKSVFNFRKSPEYKKHSIQKPMFFVCKTNPFSLICYTPPPYKKGEFTFIRSDWINFYKSPFIKSTDSVNSYDPDILEEAINIGELLGVELMAI